MNRILVPSTDYYYDSDNEEQKPVNNPIHTKPINYPWHSFYNDKRKLVFIEPRNVFELSLEN